MKRYGLFEQTIIFWRLYFTNLTWFILKYFVWNYNFYMSYWKLSGKINFRKRNFKKVEKALLKLHTYRHLFCIHKLQPKIISFHKIKMEMHTLEQVASESIFLNIIKYNSNQPTFCQWCFQGLLKETIDLKSVYEVITKLDTWTRFQCKNYENDENGKNDKKHLKFLGNHMKKNSYL